jgi:iron complex outermembrane receptor protein
MRWISELRGEFLAKGKHLRNLILHFDADPSFEQRHAFTSYDTETPTPGYTILNAGMSGNIMNKNKVLFSIYLNVSNIGDVAWQSHLSRLKYTDLNPQTSRQGVFNMGRNFSFKLNFPLNFE